MTKTSARKNRWCPVCGANEKKKLLRQEFAHFKESFDFSYDLVVCTVCGEVFADKVADQKQYDQYYAELSKYEDAKGAGRASKEMTKSHERIIGIVEKFVQSKEANIIDIGSASGDLLNEFKTRGFKNIFGFDPSRACKETAISDLGIKIEVATIQSYRPKQRFDVGVLSHVLEHIIDTNAAMRKFRKILKTGALLYVEVPAADKFSLKPDGFYEHFSIEHVNYFSQKTLNTLMKRFGFKPVFMRTSLNKAGFYPEFPVIQSLWKMKELPNKKNLIKKDIELLKEINKYISICKTKIKKINTKIEKLVSSQKKLIIWGAGSHTLKLLSNTNLSRANIEAIVDDTKSLQGKKLGKFLIKAPEKVLERRESPILISSVNFQEAIAKRITKGIGAKNPIIRIYPKK